MSWHNKLTVSEIFSVACVHCYRLPDSDLHRACKITQFLLKFAEKQCFHCAWTISVILRLTIAGLALIASPKIVLCNGQPFKASILLLTEIYEYNFERFLFLSTSEASATGVRTDRNKGIRCDNNNHIYQTAQ